MLTLHNGRPADTDGRQPREIRVYDFLDSIGIEYQRVDHDPAMTMEVCADIDKSLGAPICKNLFLCNRQKTRFFLLMTPGDKRFLTKDITRQIGSARLSFADGDAMLQYLDTLPGSVSVLGLINDRDRAVQLVIDRDILECESVGCHPCVNTSSLRISISDLTGRILPALGHEPILVTL